MKQPLVEWILIELVKKYGNLFNPHHVGLWLHLINK